MQIIEQVKADFLIDATTVSPLLQIEPSNKKDINTKASIVETKKMNYINEDGKISNEPFFSANGFRGILRRNISKAIFEALKNRHNKEISIDTLHLYTAGGGTASNGFVKIFEDKLNYSQEQEFRDANAFISLFGAGLSDIDGKLSVTNMSPKMRDKKLTDYLFGVRFDETERASILTPFLSEEDVEKYQKDMIQKKNENKDIRKLNDQINKIKEKEKKGEEVNSEELANLELAYSEKLEEKSLIFQQVYKAEFIIPNTQLSSSIGTRAGHKLNELEKSMMLYGLIATSKQNIGSYSRIGWGALNYSIKDADGNVLFTTKCDDAYILNKKVDVSKKGMDMLKPFTEWLENFEVDGIFLP